MTAEHRVSLLGSRLHRNEDPEQSRDPRVRAVVTQLRSVELPAPRAHFRAELRAQLVAVAPRLVADGAAETAAERTRAAAARQREHKRRRIPLARPLAVVATLLAVCALVLGGAVWMSKKALPGDTLYGLKRTSEDVQLSFASNDVERATDYLHFSQNRVAEAKALLARASAAGTGVNAGGVSASQATLLISTLGSADSQLKQGWTLFAKHAQSSGSGDSLNTMTSWAPGQIQRLEQLAAAMPNPALRSRTDSSTELVGFALDRARTLRSTLARPATTTPTRPTTGGGTGTRPGSTGHRSAPTHAPATQSGGSHATPAPRRTAARPATPSSRPSASKTNRALLPSLPLELPKKLPLISSCGISLPLGINLGTCSKHP